MNYKRQKPKQMNIEMEIANDQENQELKYMLAELEAKQSALSLQINRFEQLANFYFSGVTAIAGALVLFITSPLLAPYNILSAMLILLALAGFSTSMYLRLLITKVAIVASYASRNAVRFYFSKRFPKTVLFVEDITPNEMYGIWRFVFSKQVIGLFTVMIGFNGLSFSVGIAVLAHQVPPLIGIMTLENYFVLILGVVLFSLRICPKISWSISNCLTVRIDRVIPLREGLVIADS